MYEQFSNEDNDKPAVDGQAALRLILEAIDGPPPTTSRQGKDSLFGSKEAVANALAKSYLTPEKKSGESTGIDILADLAAASTAASMLYMTGKNGPVQKILSKDPSFGLSLSEQYRRARDKFIRESSAELIRELEKGALKNPDGLKVPPESRR